MNKTRNNRTPNPGNFKTHQHSFAMAQPQRFIYSISQLTNEAKELLEGTFPLIWIEGEISNFSTPSSGHWYFSLKDSQSQVRCAMFRMRSMHIPFRPKNGDQVLIRARVSLYTPRGDFQLIAEHMEEAGDGALRRAFEELKQRLQQQGMFNNEHKKTLPAHPKHIGVITSPSGAAVRDILQILKRRAPWIPVTLYPAAVQGEQAPEQLIEMIQQAVTDQRCDVLILGRGGGSMEDLWAFNDERLAHTIFQCPIPIISAVGHEIDYTISDFVADQRAPTPSAAAELISPDRDAWLTQLKRLEQRLLRNMQNGLQEKQRQLSWITQRIRHPQQRLLEQSQRVDELERRLQQAQRLNLKQRQQTIALLEAKIRQNSPQHKLAQYQLRFQQLEQRLNNSCRQQLKQHRQRLSQQAHQLNAVSPLATLSRGYAIATLPENGEVLRSTKQIKLGQTINLQLNQGKLQATVDQYHDE